MGIYTFVIHPVGGKIKNKKRRFNIGTTDSTSVPYVTYDVGHLETDNGMAPK